MSLVKPRTMQGVMELLPGEQIAFQRAFDTIRRGFERFGYSPIETPSLELTDVLLKKSGGDTEKQVYFAQSTGARQQGKEPDLALRFDLTVPLARYVAQHEGRLTFPFRRYQMQQVYRGERPQRGRYRVFYQCDIDVIGKDALDPAYDAEVPAVMIGIFEQLAIGDFTVQINNRKVLLGYLASLGIDAEAQPLVVREIDKIDKRGEDYLRETLAADGFGLGADVIAKVLEFIATRGTPREVLAALRELDADNETFRIGRDELTTVVEGLEGLGVDPQRYRLNLAIARGLDYYTGTVYETFLDAHPELGSICSGGRYDDLASHYTKSQLPGVGMSIGLTRLFYLMQELGLTGEAESVADVLVTQQDAELRGEYLSIAAELRSAGIPTESVLESWKFKKQMKYANTAGIPLVLIVGSSEHAAGEVTIKNMKTGEQSTIARASLVDSVVQTIATQRSES